MLNIKRSPILLCHQSDGNEMHIILSRILMNNLRCKSNCRNVEA